MCRSRPYFQELSSVVYKLLESANKNGTRARAPEGVHRRQLLDLSTFFCFCEVVTQLFCAHWDKNRWFWPRESVFAIPYEQMLRYVGRRLEGPNRNPKTGLG